MSKAFMKDDDGGEDGLDGLDSDDDVSGAAVRPKMLGHQYITPQGRKKLESELDWLWKSERPRVTREVEAAAAMGDRSENAEYIYGKRRLREIDRRLRFLSKRLETAVAVVRSPEQDGRVYFGAWVTLRDEDGKKVTYRLVGGDEIDLAKRWISIDSPMGRAILGKSIGDVVLVQRPRGEAEFEVVEISYNEPA